MASCVSPFALAAAIALATSLTLFAMLMVMWGPVAASMVYLASVAVFLELVHRTPLIDEAD